jgi:hypothetical protein
MPDAPSDTLTHLTQLAIEAIAQINPHVSRFPSPLWSGASGASVRQAAQGQV